MASKPTKEPLDVRYDVRMTQPIQFESGTYLGAGDVVHVDSEYEDALGIKWTDRDGTHVAAIRKSYAERLR